MDIVHVKTTGLAYRRVDEVRDSLIPPTPQRRTAMQGSGLPSPHEMDSLLGIHQAGYFHELFCEAFKLGL